MQIKRERDNLSHFIINTPDAPPNTLAPANIVS